MRVSTSLGFFLSACMNASISRLAGERCADSGCSPRSSSRSRRRTMRIATPTRTIAASSGRTRFNKRGLPYVAPRSAGTLLRRSWTPVESTDARTTVKRTPRPASTSLLRAGEFPAENTERLDCEIDVGLGQSESDAHSQRASLERTERSMCPRGAMQPRTHSNSISAVERERELIGLRVLVHDRDDRTRGSPGPGPGCGSRVSRRCPRRAGAERRLVLALLGAVLGQPARGRTQAHDAGHVGRARLVAVGARLGPIGCSLSPWPLPPKTSSAGSQPGARYSTPTPCGPRSPLCPEHAHASAPSVPRSTRGARRPGRRRRA